MSIATVDRRPALVLGESYLRRVVPSVFATAAQAGVSDRYAFVPTIEVLGMLADKGFRPVKAGQSSSRTPEGLAFARHVIRFRHDDFLGSLAVGDEIPELVLTNSHDRSSAYSFAAGIFRLVCSNGMTVQSSDFGSISVKHLGGSDFSDRILEATFQVVEETPRILENVAEWKGIELSRPQQLAYATAALELRDNAVVEPVALLEPRRDADKGSDLWSTSNVVQENLVKGGLRGKTSKGRPTKTRPIQSVGADLKTNKALWRLTTEMAALVAGQA